MTGSGSAGVMVGFGHQPAAVERVAAHQRDAPFGAEARAVVGVLDVGAAGQLVVHQLGVGREDDRQAVALRAQAEIQVVVDDVVGFVETAEPFEDIAADHLAGAGHRSHFAHDTGHAEGAVVGALGEAERVARMGFRQVLAAVLHFAVRVEQPGADDADLGALRLFQPGRRASRRMAPRRRRSGTAGSRRVPRRRRHC
ncbi:MAG: hypothetical protein WDN04_04620 [Rhodospirillales bacterium]